MVNSALKTDQKETTQVISKEDVAIDDKVTINIQVQKKLISDTVTDPKPSEDPSENSTNYPSEDASENLEESSCEPPGEVKNEEPIEDIPSTPRSTPNSNDDLLQQQAADMIEQVISAASQKVEIELPELLTENILQLNRNHSSEKLEAPEEAEAEPDSLSAATSTETVVENEISATKGIF